MTHCMVVVTFLFPRKAMKRCMSSDTFKKWELLLSFVLLSLANRECSTINDLFFNFVFLRYFRELCPLTSESLKTLVIVKMSWPKGSLRIYCNLKVSKYRFQLLTTYILLKLWVHFIPHFRSIKTDIYGTAEKN